MKGRKRTKSSANPASKKQRIAAPLVDDIIVDSPPVVPYTMEMTCFMDKTKLVLSEGQGLLTYECHREGVSDVIVFERKEPIKMTGPAPDGMMTIYFSLRAKDGKKVEDFPEYHQGNVSFPTSQSEDRCSGNGIDIKICFSAGQYQIRMDMFMPYGGDIFAYSPDVGHDEHIEKVSIMVSIISGGLSGSVTRQMHLTKKSPSCIVTYECPFRPRSYLLVREYKTGTEELIAANVYKIRSNSLTASQFLIPEVSRMFDCGDGDVRKNMERVEMSVHAKLAKDGALCTSYVSRDGVFMICFDTQLVDPKPPRRENSDPQEYQEDCKSHTLTALAYVGRDFPSRGDDMFSFPPYNDREIDCNMASVHRDMNSLMTRCPDMCDISIFFGTKEIGRLPKFMLLFHCGAFVNQSFTKGMKNDHLELMCENSETAQIFYGFLTSRYDRDGSAAFMHVLDIRSEIGPVKTIVILWEVFSLACTYLCKGIAVSIQEIIFAMFGDDMHPEEKWMKLTPHLLACAVLDASYSVDIDDIPPYSDTKFRYVMPLRGDVTEKSLSLRGFGRDMLESIGQFDWVTQRMRDDFFSALRDKQSIPRNPKTGALLLQH